jgi:peptidoglycan/LPS O-acetylase OafA/YrhL
MIATENQSLPRHSPGLDILRTIAILLVFTTHFRLFAGHAWFEPIARFGWAGVDLFFVLSGFLISSQLFQSIAKGEKISWKAFYLRRGLRIWPVYLAVLILYFTVPAMLERSTLPPLWKFLTFTQNFGLDSQRGLAFSHAWSLCVEEHFYLIIPFFILAMQRYSHFRKSIFVFITVILSGMTIRFFLWSHHAEFYREIYYPTYCRLDGLATGVAIAAIYRLRSTLWGKITRRANTFFVIGIVGVLAAYFVCKDQHDLGAIVFGFPLLAFSFGSLVISAVSQNGLFSKLKIPFTKLGASLAFSFYLIHKSIIHLSKDWILNAGIPETSIFYPIGIFLACVLASLPLYFIIEKPGLLLRDKLARKLKSASTLTVAMGVRANSRATQTSQKPSAHNK